MRKYSKAIVLKLPRAGSAIAPRPFPGKYPTRLLILYTDGRHYIGKPYYELGRQFASNSARGRVASMIEFDRRHIVAFLSPKAHDMFLAGRTFRAYHPYANQIAPLWGLFFSVWMSSVTPRKAQGRYAYYLNGAYPVGGTVEEQTAQLVIKEYTGK